MAHVVYPVARLQQLVEKAKMLAFMAHPAAGFFKTAQPARRKAGVAGPKVLSPDSVHLRAGAKNDPLRKNPAP